jgi:tol-pal system-associated acyl-CoA thioesterase
MPKSFVFPFRVYIEDSDFGGIVYHSNYLNFMERARSEWLNTLGFGVDYWIHKNVMFIVRHADLNYMAPARINDQLEIHSEVQAVKGSSMAFKHRVLNQSNPDVVLCEATVQLVCVNREIRPIRVPDQLREVFV